MRTVDITPTWRGFLPLLLTIYCDGTAKGRASALAELYRLADIADEVIADAKAIAAKPAPAGVTDAVEPLPDYDDYRRHNPEEGS